MKHDSKKLNTIFQYVMQSKYSDFYRTFYKDITFKSIDSYDEWAQLPLLKKGDLVKVPMWKRVFTHKNDLDVIRNTSGTSGNEILISPRTRTVDYQHVYEDFDLRGFLIFHQPIHLMEDSIRPIFPKAPIIAGDPSNMEASVILAKEAKVDGLMVFSFLLDALVPLLKKYKYTESFIYVHIIGERVTDSQYAHLKAVFPNAKIFNDYGATELQGTPLIALNNEDPSERFVMTQWDDYLIEIVHPETEQIIDEDEVEGELIVTTLWTDTNTSPLLRYKTGDIAKRVNSSMHHSGKGYEILGRLNIDRIKVAGGEIKVEEVERAIKECVPKITDYELHVYREDGEDGGKHNLELKVVATKDEIDRLREQFTKILRTAPTFTYQDGIDQNIFGECKITAVDSLTSGSKKKRLVKH